MNGPMFDIQQSNGMTAIEITRPEIDATVSDHFAQLMGDAANSIAGKEVLIDLTRVTFIQSAAIGAIITLQRNVNATGGKVRLCGMIPPIREVFRVTHLDQIFEIHETRSDAMNAARPH